MTMADGYLMKDLSLLPGVKLPIQTRWRAWLYYCPETWKMDISAVYSTRLGGGRVDWPLCTPRVPHFPLPASAVQCAKKERTRSLEVDYGFWQEFLGRATFIEAGGFLNARAIGVAWVICLTACI